MRDTRTRVLAALLLALCLPAIALPGQKKKPPPATVTAAAQTVNMTVTVDRGVRLQVMQGYEVTGFMFGVTGPDAAKKSWFETARDDVLARAAPWISRVRFECTGKWIDPDGTSYDWSSIDTRATELIVPWAAARLAATGIRLRVSLCNVAFGSASLPAYPHKDADGFARFADYALACVERVEGHGLTVDAWEICLEPDNTAGGGTRFNSAQRVAAAVKAVRAKLDGAGYGVLGEKPVRIIAPSCVNALNAKNWALWIRDNDALAWAAIDEVAYHGYTSSSVPIPQEIASLAAAYGKTSSMLEYLSAPLSRIWTDVHVAGAPGASVWQRYALANNLTLGGSNAMGGSYRIDPTTGVVSTNYPTPEAAQHFRAVTPGTQRIGCSQAGGPCLAYEQPDLDTVVVVSIPSGWTVRVQGTAADPLPDGVYDVSYATPPSGTTPGTTVSLAPLTVAGGSFLFTAPAHGLFLFVQL
jgi:hypothetical protein